MSLTPCIYNIWILIVICYTKHNCIVNTNCGSLELVQLNYFKITLVPVHLILNSLKSKYGASKRGFRPSFFFFPLSFDGEGDTGGEVEKKEILRFAHNDTVGDNGGWD